MFHVHILYVLYSTERQQTTTLCTDSAFRAPKGLWREGGGGKSSEASCLCSAGGAWRPLYEAAPVSSLLRGPCAGSSVMGGQLWGQESTFCATKYLHTEMQHSSSVNGRFLAN